MLFRSALIETKRVIGLQIHMLAAWEFGKPRRAASHAQFAGGIRAVKSRFEFEQTVPYFPGGKLFANTSSVRGEFCLNVFASFLSYVPFGTAPPITFYPNELIYGVVAQTNFLSIPPQLHKL
jgi:hypothetical protein